MPVNSASQSTLQVPQPPGHVAIIMDGNGRWATRSGLPRTAGHVEGAKAVRSTVESAARAGVRTLTLYAFSSANWARPPAEVGALMRLFRRYLFTETRRCIEQSIRLSVIGRRDRLSESLLRCIEQSERLSAGGTRMLLRLAIDYSSQHSILQALRRSENREGMTHDAFQKLLCEVDHSAQTTPPVDLLIRTGGEQRLSDFMLWEAAYAELYFTDCLWPDFDEQRLRRALDDFSGRQRRFGALPGAVPDAPPGAAPAQANRC
jgi:undecaprenyl diphosphate synthase